MDFDFSFAILQISYPYKDTPPFILSVLDFGLTWILPKMMVFDFFFAILQVSCSYQGPHLPFEWPAHEKNTLVYEILTPLEFLPKWRFITFSLLFCKSAAPVRVPPFILGGPFTKKTYEILVWSEFFPKWWILTFSLLFCKSAAPIRVPFFIMSGSFTKKMP